MRATYVIWSIVLIVACTGTVHGNDFTRYLENIDTHNAVKRLSQQEKAQRAEGKARLSWGDPVLKAAAKNFPMRGFPHYKTPMTGVEFGLFQKIPISDRRELEDSASKAMAKSTYWSKRDLTSRLRLEAWQTAIQWTAKAKALIVLKESDNWLAKKIQVTKSLYANGKGSQQAILELQIRMSEIQSMIERKRHEQKAALERLQYLFGAPIDLESTIMPWATLESPSEDGDLSSAERALKAKAEAKSFERRARSSAQTPDITVGLSYTFRDNIDRNGDFISLSVQIPLPVSDKTTDRIDTAASTAAAAQLAYDDYKEIKTTRMAQTKITMDRIAIERKIIADQTLNFAKAARNIASKAYALAETSYVELLSAELSLQKIILKDIELWSKMQSSRAQLKYLKGDKLW